MSNIERRFVTATELRAATSAGKKVLRGYASKFNTPSRGLPFIERVKPGAFSRAIREKQDCKFLMNHDPNLVMGRVGNRTLSLREDNVGLAFEVELPDTTAAKDLYTLCSRGDISQCSFGFMARSDRWGKEQNAAGDWQASRDLLDVDLQDCSAVTFPVYSDTEVDTGEQNGFSLQEIERNSAVLWPNGIPAEVRAHMGHYLNSGSEQHRLHMQNRLSMTFSLEARELAEKYGAKVQQEHGPLNRSIMIGGWDWVFPTEGHKMAWAEAIEHLGSQRH